MTAVTSGSPFYELTNQMLAPPGSYQEHVYFPSGLECSVVKFGCSMSDITCSQV